MFKILVQFAKEVNLNRTFYNVAKHRFSIAKKITMDLKNCSFFLHCRKLLNKKYKNIIKW